MTYLVDNEQNDENENEPIKKGANTFGLLAGSGQVDGNLIFILTPQFNLM